MLVDTIEYKGHNINIWQDEVFSINPREDYDQLSRLVNANRHTDRAGQGQGLSNYVLDNLDMEKVQRYISLILGGVSHTFWTSGAGTYLAYFDRDVIDREWSGDKEAALRYLKAESETYLNWAEGYVYGFEIEDSEDMFSTCGGFYGWDHEESGLLEHAREVIDIIVEKEQALQAEMDEMIAVEVGR